MHKGPQDFVMLISPLFSRVKFNFDWSAVNYWPLSKASQLECESSHQEECTVGHGHLLCPISGQERGPS